MWGGAVKVWACGDILEVMYRHENTKNYPIYLATYLTEEQAGRLKQQRHELDPDASMAAYTRELLELGMAAKAAQQQQVKP